MKMIEALQATLDFLEANGYESGDIHDDLVIVIRQLKRHPEVAREELK